MSLIGAGWALDPLKGRILKDWAVTVENGFITDSGPIESLVARYPSYEKITRRKGVLTPALANSHTHIPMTLLRGVSQQTGFSEWFERSVAPVEHILKANREHVLSGALQGAAELALSGVGFFIDMYFHEEEVLRAGVEAGLRGVYTYGMADLGDEATAAEEIAEAKRFISAVKRMPEELARSAMAPHAPYTCSPGFLKELSSIGKDLDLELQMHVGERPDELELIANRFSEKVHSLSEYLERLGCLKNMTIFHGTHLTRSDLARLKRNNCKLVLNPTSNLRLGNGIPPINAAKSEGVRTALGTDGAASNDELYLLNEVKLYCLLSMVQAGDPVTPIEAFRAATLPVSWYFGTRVGLEKGCTADLALFEPRFAPVSNPLNNLTYSPGMFTCTNLLVNGRAIVSEGRLVTLNMSDVRRRFRKSLETIRNKVVAEN